MKSEAEYFAFVSEPIPTPTHQQERKVGMENRKQINRLPTIPTIPTIPTDKCGNDAVTPAPDIAAFEERAAIAEHDGGQARDDAETQAAQEQGFGAAADLHQAAVARLAAEIDRLADLGTLDPETATALRRAQRFIAEGWALQAVRLGWDELELFGVCPRAPWARLDRKGAAFGGAVQAVTREAVVYVGGLRRYRVNINNDGGAAPVWALAQDADEADGGSAA